MKTQHKTVKAIGMLLLISSNYISIAQASSCGVAGANLDTSDVTFDSSGSTNCGMGISKNNSNIDINTTQSGEFLFNGLGWGDEIKDNQLGNEGPNTGSFLGIDWTLNASAGDTGSWIISIIDPVPASLPVTVDLLAVLKGGNSWAGYLFESKTFSVEGDTAGTFEIVFTNNGGQNPNLSHMSLYLREGVSSTSPVPVPAAAWLFGTGLIGLTGLQRKKKSL